jgi:1,4-dihydroxy-2-naphthoate octaprenyltransferase
MSSTTMPRHRAWLLAARPKTLPAAVGPVLVGSALAFADGQFAAGPALAALLTALLLQIGSNFANDYFDYFRGADPHDRRGPPRATASGLIRPAEMRWGMMVIFGAAALVGLYLIAIGGWPVVWIGVAAILAALAYTGGPFPFGYYGLGDLFVLIFFGLVAVGGTYYVQAQTVTLAVIVAALAPGFLITAILVVNNLRDIETDRRANKRTLAVILGRRATLVEYRALLIGAYLVPLLLWIWGDRTAWVMLPFVTLPWAFQLARRIGLADDGPAFNALLAATAQLSLVFSTLLALGVVIAS